MEPIDKLKRSLRHYWHDDSSSYLVSREDMDQVDSILDSLLPENSKTFTLAEVEAIAREAFTQGIKYLNNANAMPFDIYWQSKLKEWGEV